MDQRTIETYNQTAEAYDLETVGFWDQFPRTVLDNFSERVQGKVLDLGSGPGRDGLILQANGLEVVCLDASAEMIKLSSARGLESVLGDFLNLPFANGSFGAVWAYTSLLHVSKSEVGQALTQIHRILVQEGVLGLGLIEGETEEYRESAGVGLPRWFSFYTKAEVEALLDEHGFEVVYFESFRPRHKNYLNFIAQKL